MVFVDERSADPHRYDRVALVAWAGQVSGPMCGGLQRPRRPLRDAARLALR
jgi:hypothetical protein